MPSCPTKRGLPRWKWWAPLLVMLVLIVAAAAGFGSQDPGGEPGEAKPSCWNKSKSSLNHGYGSVDKSKCNGATICMQYSCEGTVDCTASGNTGCNWCLVGLLYKKVNGYYVPLSRNELGSGVVNCGDTDSISGQFFDAQPKGSEMWIQFKVYKKCDPDLGEVLSTKAETFTVQ